MNYKLIAFTISTLLLMILLIYSDFLKVIQTLTEVNILYFLITLLLWFSGFMLRVKRWEYLLKQVKITIPYESTMLTYMLGTFFSNLSPAKLADPFRSVILKASFKKAMGDSLPSIFIERLFDFLLIILFTLFGLLSMILFKTFWLLLPLLIYIFLFLLTIYILKSEHRISAFGDRIINFFSFVKRVKKARKKVKRFSKNLHTAFTKYCKFKILLITFLYSFLVWLVEGTILFMSFKALDVDISLGVAIVAISVGTLIGVLSFLPGGLGASETTIFTIVAKFTLLPPAKVTAAILLSRFFSFWLYMLLGMIILNFWKIPKPKEFL